MRWIYALTVACLAASTAEAITWIQAPQNQEKFPGREVVLTCQVSGEYTSINWLGKTKDQNLELLFFKNYDQEPQEFKTGQGFSIKNGFDLVIEVSEFCPAIVRENKRADNYASVVLRKPHDYFTRSGKDVKVMSIRVFCR